MQIAVIVIVAAAVFGLCFLVDRGFTRVFRGKKQHLSGKAVRASKRYALFGVVLSVLGVLAVISGLTEGTALLYGGIIVLLMGLAMAVYYLSFGIYYDDDSFLVSSFGRKSVEYRYEDIARQQLFAVSGGNTIVELVMQNGKSVSINSTMEGAYPFLDEAFDGWCRQKQLTPEDCPFHDPDKSWWFPHEEA